MKKIKILKMKMNKKKKNKNQIILKKIVIIIK